MQLPTGAGAPVATSSAVATFATGYWTADAIECAPEVAVAVAVVIADALVAYYVAAAGAGADAVAAVVVIAGADAVAAVIAVAVLVQSEILVEPAELASAKVSSTPG